MYVESIICESNELRIRTNRNEYKRHREGEVAEKWRIKQPTKPIYTMRYDMIREHSNRKRKWNLWLANEQRRDKDKDEQEKENRKQRKRNTKRSRIRAKEKCGRARDWRRVQQSTANLHTSHIEAENTLSIYICYMDRRI